MDKLGINVLANKRMEPAHQTSRAEPERLAADMVAFAKRLVAGTPIM